MNLAPEIAAAFITAACTIFVFIMRDRRRKKHYNASHMPRIESESVHAGVLVKLMRRQGGRCAISGMELTENQASIERLYGTPGNYENGSVRIVMRDIKRLKRDMPDEKFLRICKAVAKHQENTNG